MTESMLATDSLVAVDVSEITTRAVLFDIVGGRYRFLAAGSAQTTLGAPYYDIGEGVHLAFNNLQQISGRSLLDVDGRLKMPGAPDGSGVDNLVVNFSAGPPLRVVVIGLLEDISVESACRLAKTTYTRVVRTFNLNDRMKVEDRIDAIMKVRPDLIIVAGGTDGGASHSVMQMIESVGLACRLFQPGQTPEVLFAGNQMLIPDVKAYLDNLSNLHISPNVRPTIETEQISPSQLQMSQIYRALRIRQIAGVHELDTWASGRLFSTGSTFGRMIQFLSGIYDSKKGVLGIDISESATTLAASSAGELTLGVYPELGLGSGVTGFLEACPLADIKRWMQVESNDDYIRDYIYNRSCYPGTIPINNEDLEIEQALVRQAIRIAVNRNLAYLSATSGRISTELLPYFEPIVAAGSFLTRSPTLGQCLLMLLDGLQPNGITTLVLDQNHLTALLGAAASVHPLLSVQVLESNTFLNLGTVISPIATVRMGTPILRIKMKDESHNNQTMEVKQGELEVINLPLGQTAQLHLQPYNRADVGMGGPGRGGTVKVVGGALGVVIDARGRPLNLPADFAQRRDLQKKWLWSLGG